MQGAADYAVLQFDTCYGSKSYIASCSGRKTNLTKSLGAKYRRTKCGKATVQPKLEPKLVPNPDLKPKLTLIFWSITISRRPCLIRFRCVIVAYHLGHLRDASHIIPMASPSSPALPPLLSHPPSPGPQPNSLPPLLG